MTDSSKHPGDQPAELGVTFVGLADNEQAPRFAAYLLDNAGHPVKKVGVYDGRVFRLDAGKAQLIALGPDVEDVRSLAPENLVSYRLPQKLEEWRNGLVLGRDIWDRFLLHFACVSGTVSKCRPWYWRLLADSRLAPSFALAQLARVKPLTAELLPHIYFPVSCRSICDGIVEIYERECCCRLIPIPLLIDRLREILDILPIPLPEPLPGPFPGPGPDPAPFTPLQLRSRARIIQRRKAAIDFNAIPPAILHQDYLALRSLPHDAATVYVRERTYLWPIFCHCSVRKVGQTSIQPGGKFDLCYLQLPRGATCITTYAYKVRQLIGGVLTLVYDGLAAHQYFSAGAPATIHTYNPLARLCADGPGDAPPNDGVPFIMLEHVGAPGTHHFNFPPQTGVSQLAALDDDDGTYTTGYAPDCPWGAGLGLRLWFSPELAGVASYYRLKVVGLNDAGMAVGAPRVLSDSVTWDKLVDVPGDVVTAPEPLGPNTVGAENNLFTIPYWSSPNHRYLSGQYHQVWNTAHTLFPDGKYLLLLEVFDSGGNRIKPAGAIGPGAPATFQFRRWAGPGDTDPVPYADLAHAFWIDNTPVGGDIVDLRKGGVINTAECQFLSGPGSTTFGIGLRAYHLHGVEHAGNGDDNSFMYRYDISWQRGLNGNSGSLGPAPGGSNHTDVGETGGAVASDTETFETMLTKTTILPGGIPVTVVLPKCTFSVTLHVAAKHFTGSARIDAYDYLETASFALEISP